MLSTFKGKTQQSHAISSALSLHCYFDNNSSVQQTTHNDDLLICASKCQAGAFSPTATAIWMTLVCKSCLLLIILHNQQQQHQQKQQPS